MRTLLPDRSKKQARELTTAVRADDEQVVRLRCAHELTGRRPFEPARARRASSEPSTPTTIRTSYHPFRRAEYCSACYL
jgi:hypothetical protein